MENPELGQCSLSSWTVRLSLSSPRLRCLTVEPDLGQGAHLALTLPLGNEEVGQMLYIWLLCKYVILSLSGVKAP